MGRADGSQVAPNGADLVRETLREIRCRRGDRRLWSAPILGALSTGKGDPIPLDKPRRKALRALFRTVGSSASPF